MYRGVSRPASFGSGALTGTNNSSGDRFGADTADSFLFVPPGYVSGTALSDSATFEGQTFATLGVTPGIYVYDWGSGDHTDTLTIVIGGEVPEPSTWAMMLLGFAGLVLAGYRAARKTVAVGLLRT